MKNSITDLAGWALSRQIHEKNISCTEVMAAYLKQISAVNPSVNAIVALQEEDALMAQAREKDAQLAQGNDGGWMHGFPHAAKDLAMTKGIVTTMGSPIFKDFVPQEDELVVKRIKAAGAIIIGKTNTPEWGYGSQTYNEVYGATGNPYDATKTAGGSSGGAACAVALHMQAVTDGSDFMGSLRNPAGYCNIYGYRPSVGRVPYEGAELFLNNCGTLGPMARTVPDLALLLATQSGDAEIPWSLADDAQLKSLTASNVLDKLNIDVKGRKVAWLGDWNGYLPMEDGVLEVCEKALGTLPDMGVAVEAIQNPFNPEVMWKDIWLPFRHFAANNLKVYYEDPQKKALLKPEAIWEYEGGLGYSAADLYQAGVKRSQWLKALMKVFEEYDYIAVPTAQVFPFDKTIHWPEEIGGHKMDTYHRWMEVVTPWTLSGNPVVAVPAGFNKNGLPMGIQIIGKNRSDFDLLQFAYAYEQTHDYVNQFPPSLKI